MNNNPLVSIGVASYNNARFILETLESIKRQCYPGIELIIVDDCSKDNSVAVIEEWIIRNEFPARFIKHSTNLGITKVCNVLLNACSSAAKYFVVIGSDDIMEPHRISKQVEQLESQSLEHAFIFSDMVMIDENGTVVGASYYEKINESFASINNLKKKDRLDQLAYFIDKNIFPAPSVLYRKQILLDLGGWDERLYFEDWDMNLRLIEKGFQFIPLEEKLVRYRVLQTSLVRKPNPAYWESYLLLILKYKGVSPSIDRIIKEKVLNLADVIYEANGRRSFKWLSKKLVMKPDLKTLLLTLLSFVGIKKQIVDKAKSILSYK